MESVLITMKTKQITPDDEEETELMTAGTCERKDGVLTLSYEDTRRHRVCRFDNHRTGGE